MSDSKVVSETRVVLLGSLAIYLAFAFLINDMFGKGVLPVGKPFRA